MLVMFAAIAALAAATPPVEPATTASTKAPAPREAAPQGTTNAPAAKPAQVCTVRKVGKILGHAVTHKKCVDAKPASAPSA